MGRRKNINTIDEIMKLKGTEMDTGHYRYLLDNVEPSYEVVAYSTQQGGTVEKVIRNRYGVPVCLKVRAGENDEIVDYISVDRVSHFEARSCSVDHAFGYDPNLYLEKSDEEYDDMYDEEYDDEELEEDNINEQKEGC